MQADAVSGSASGNILVREMRLMDIMPLYRLHMVLSGKERRLYHPFPYVPWKLLLLLCGCYLTSHMAAARYIVPRASFRALVAVDRDRHEHTGFAYLLIPKKHPVGKRVAALGIVVDKAHRGWGVSKYF